MQSPQGPWLSRGVIALVGTLAAIYLVSQFLRNSVGVIAPDNVVTPAPLVDYLVANG